MAITRKVAVDARSARHSPSWTIASQRAAALAVVRKRVVLVGNDPTAVLAAASCGVASRERLSPQVKAR